jgi:MFS family permease
MIVTFGLLSALFAAGYGVMFTVLDDFRNEYGIAEAALGWVVAVGFFSAFVAQIAIAPLADRGHARQLVLAGMLFNVGGLVAMAAGSTIVTLLVARVVMGIGAGMAAPALRRIVILADPAHLGQNLGRLLAADVAGFAAGPAISALLVGPVGLPMPFLVIAGATALCLPVILRVRVDEAAERARVERFAFDLLSIRPYAAAVVLACAEFLMIGTFDALWALVLDDLGASEWMSNLGITLFALPLVVFASTGGRLAQWVGPFRVSTAGLLAAAVCMLLYGRMPTAAGMFAVAMFQALSDGITMSAAGVAAGMVVPAERQASAQGLLGGVQTLVAGVTAAIAAAIYDDAGRTAAFTACAATMLVLTGWGAFLAGDAWSLRGERRAPEPVAPAPARASGG